MFAAGNMTANCSACILIASRIYTRVVRKVLRLCLYLKKYSSLENKTYTILKNSYLLICMQYKKIYVLI